MTPVLQQAGAIPFRYGVEGLQILLITSRRSGRWVIPKGSIEKGDSAPETAAREAFEEAGVRGSMSNAPLGVFTQTKRARNGIFHLARVEVYALHVEKELRKWPERAQRRLKWVSVDEAVRLLHMPDVSELVLKLSQSQEPALIYG